MKDVGRPNPAAVSSPALPLLAAVQIGVATRRNGRRRNEDAVGIAGWVLHGDVPISVTVTLPIEPETPVVVAVTDGMGGHAAGDVAARIAADQLTRFAASTPDELAEAFRRADEAIHVGASGERRGMGCTAAAVLVQATGMSVIANVGDVRAYRMVGGYLAQITVDDRPDPVPAAAQSGVVTGWLGGPRRTRVHEHRFEQRLDPGDRLVLCTDGLHHLGKETLQRCARGDPRAAADQLVAAAGDGGDNVTVVVMDVCGPADGAASPTSGAGQDPIARPASVVSALNEILPSQAEPARPARSRRGAGELRAPALETTQ